MERQPPAFPLLTMQALDQPEVMASPAALASVRLTEGSPSGQLTGHLPLPPGSVMPWTMWPMSLSKRVSGPKKSRVPPGP